MVEENILKYRNHFMETITIHKNLATYFQSKPLYWDGEEKQKPNVRKFAEQPWQYIHAGLFAKLIEFLSGIDVFLHYSDTDRFEIWRFWNNTGQDFGKHYLKFIPNWKEKTSDNKEKLERALNELSHLFYVCGRKEDSLTIIQESYNLSKEIYSENDIRTAIRGNNMAASLISIQKFVEAEKLWHKSWPIIRNYFGEDHPNTWAARAALGILQLKTGRFEDAKVEMNSVLEWTLHRFGENNHATIIQRHNLADLYEYIGEDYAAEEQLLLTLKPILEIYGQNHQLMRNYSKTLQRVQKRISMGTNLENKDKSIVWLLNYVKVLVNSGENKTALNVLADLEKKCVDSDKLFISDRYGLARCLYLKAQVYNSTGQINKAVKEGEMALSFAKESSEELEREITLFLKKIKC